MYHIKKKRNLEQNRNGKNQESGRPNKPKFKAMTEEVTGDLNSSEWESEIEEILEEKSVSNVSDVEINSFIAAANPN